MIRRFAPLLLLIAAAPAFAQAPATAAPTTAPAASAPPVAAATPPAEAPPPASPVEAPKPATVQVALDTAAGRIVLAIETERAPLSAKNFLRYVDGKKLDGTGFYRAANIAPGYGLVQFGTRYDPKRTLPPIALEPTSKTGLSHTDGAISMARAGPNTGSGDFFIVVGDMKSMDADPTQPGDNQGFAVFGHVVEGMDVVKKILEAPTSPTEGEGVMKGQMLSPVVTIADARRAP